MNGSAGSAVAAPAPAGAPAPGAPALGSGYCRGVLGFRVYAQVHAAVMSTLCSRVCALQCLPSVPLYKLPKSSSASNKPPTQPYTLPRPQHPL